MNLNQSLAHILVANIGNKVEKAISCIVASKIHIEYLGISWTNDFNTVNYRMMLIKEDLKVHELKTLYC